MKAIVNNSCCQILHREKLPRKTVGKTIEVEFSTDWEGLAITAVFEAGDVKKDVVYTGESIIIPHEVLAAEGLSVMLGFHGALPDGTIVKRTVPEWLNNVSASLDPSGETSSKPTPDWAAQVQTIALKAKEAADSVRSDAEAGKFNGPAGKAGGWYTPAVTQPTKNTMQVVFTPSKTTMPAVDGTEITLPDGTRGADGKSAYQYAQEGGYTGTEAEFSARMAAEIPTVDSTLAQSGQAADAAVVGNRLSALAEEIANLNTDGISATARNLLITILRNGVYSSDQKANITDLETALGGSDAPVVKSYAITNTLTNCTTNNAVTSVTDGDSYTATLTAADGYALNSVVVTMGGTDITSTAYSSSVITIASVTGDVSIVATAVAAESGGGETVVNLFDKSTMVVSGAFVGANGAISTSATSKYAKIPISVGTYALQKGSGWAMSTTGHPSLIDSAGNVLCKFGNLQANGNAGSPSDASIGTIAKANGNAGIAVTVLSEAVTHIIFSICVNGGTDDTDTTMMEVGDTCHDYVAHV